MYFARSTVKPHRDERQAQLFGLFFPLSFPCQIIRYIHRDFLCISFAKPSFCLSPSLTLGSCKRGITRLAHVEKPTISHRESQQCSRANPPHVVYLEEYAARAVVSFLLDSSGSQDRRRRLTGACSWLIWAERKGTSVNIQNILKEAQSSLHSLNSMFRNVGDEAANERTLCLLAPENCVRVAWHNIKDDALLRLFR